MYNRSEIEALLGHEGHPCVSVYAPVEQRGRETRKNGIILKDALREAHRQLAQAGVDEDAADRLLAPLAEKQADEAFLQHLGLGFAAFLAPDFAWMCTVPARLTDATRVVVGNGFHIRPLLPQLSRDGRFFVLALDREHVRLFAASRHGMRPADGDLPEGWGKARGMTDYEQQTGFHASGPGPSTTGGVAITRHAHGESPAELRKQETVEFVRDVAREVGRAMAQEKDVPLVVCGDPEMRGLFREHSTVATRPEWEIDVHPGALNEETLHRRAYEAVEDHFRDVREQAAESFAALRGEGSERADDSIETLVPAAAQGRIDTLFAARDTEVPGIFNEQTQRASRTDRDVERKVELIELAVRETLKHGGRAFVVDADKVPGDGPLAAVYRY